MRVYLKNEELWKISENGENIDAWLNKNVGYHGWREWVGMGITQLPYRCFEIHDDKLLTLFILKWNPHVKRP